MFSTELVASLLKKMQSGTTCRDLPKTSFTTFGNFSQKILFATTREKITKEIFLASYWIFPRDTLQQYFEEILEK